MAFPLPIDPDFRKEVVRFWLEDVDDRLNDGRLQEAEESWKQANSLYLSLGPGEGNLALEDLLYQTRVKLDQTSQRNQ